MNIQDISNSYQLDNLIILCIENKKRYKLFTMAIMETAFLDS